mmetsp:Transcript_128092/g.190877  ORF Transcript_128092/g.190877 Transcript_128092/m.190877 type:complete len:200 (+) Transcript_128092:3-602(+)
MEHNSRGTGAISKYAYLVMLFQIGMVGLFTYLFIDNKEQIDSGCTQTPLNSWWIVSISFAYFASFLGILCAFTKEFTDYRKRKLYKSLDQEISSINLNALNIIKTISPVVGILGALFVLLLVFFNVWSFVGSIFLIIDADCVGKELYQIFVVWLVLCFCSSFMSVCCCFCSCSSLFANFGESAGMHKLTAFIKGYEFDD